VDAYDLAGGVAVEDFDGDGLLDVVTSSMDPRTPLRFFRNTGQGGFEPRAEEAGLSEQLGGLNVLTADYDGDGDFDLLVLRGAWLKDLGQIRNSLLRNDGSGRFTDVTHQAGLARPARPSQAAVWGDFDGDGDLDLFVGNESRREIGSPPGGEFPSQLFRNDGDGSFTDVAGAAGVTNDRYCKGVTAGDYDNDGDLDLYVSNTGPNRLYRNDGGGRFRDVALEAGVVEPAGHSFAAWFFDVDNDGWLDLFVGPYEASLVDIANDYLGRTSIGERPRLYRNERGRFRDVTRGAGLQKVCLPMGANFGDLDGDGFLDVFLATGGPSYALLVPNRTFLNDGRGGFREVTRTGGFGHLQKGHGVAFADLDEDGDQDVYNQLGGFFRGDAYRNALFLNPGRGHRWLKLRLVGAASPRSGVGARIRVVVDTPRGVREIHRAVGSVSSFGGSPLRQEIGLGDARAVRRVEIRWPRTPEPQVLEGVELDAALVVTEGRAGFRVETRAPIPFK
jgi:hypothetical protein